MCHSGDDAAKMDVICCVVFNQRRFECCWQALASHFKVTVGAFIVLFSCCPLRSHSPQQPYICYESFNSGTLVKKCCFTRHMFFFSFFFQHSSFSVHFCFSDVTTTCWKECFVTLFGSMMRYYVCRGCCG